jgi:hypothetical protein
MCEFCLNEFLTFYCWPFTKIHLHCSDNFILKKKFAFLSVSCTVLLDMISHDYILIVFRRVFYIICSMYSYLYNIIRVHSRFPSHALIRHLLLFVTLKRFSSKIVIEQYVTSDWYETNKLYPYVYVAFWVGCGPQICDWPGQHLTSLRPWT